MFKIYYAVLKHNTELSYKDVNAGVKRLSYGLNAI